MKANKNLLIPVAAVAGLLIINACKIGIPKGAKPVTHFNASKYLGKWFEIARFDYIFEKGLEQCTAEYSTNADGSIQVVNRGFKPKTNQWKESRGEAKFIDEENVGRLKVSFFKPFWAGYNVISVDDDYKYALVAGNSRKYLWILSRTTEIPEDIKEKYLKTAKELGYNTDKLIWTRHRR